MAYENYVQLITFWMILAVAIFVLLLFVTAPYGRHSKTTWGPLIDNRLAWILMEFFVLVVFYYFIFTGSNTPSLVNWMIIGLLTFHYLNRSLIFPLRLKTRGKKMPVVIMLMGFAFNLMNGFFIGYFLGNFKVYDIDWLFTPNFIIGISIFVIGVVINWKSDGMLINLRKPNETGYKIPQDWIFRYVSSPNLLGEVIEWLGFAILTWCLPGWAFFMWTFANLVPRALSHHKWYKSHFIEYPTDRKAIFPWIL